MYGENVRDVVFCELGLIFAVAKVAHIKTSKNLKLKLKFVSYNSDGSRKLISWEWWALKGIGEKFEEGSHQKSWLSLDVNKYFIVEQVQILLWMTNLFVNN